MKLLPGHTMPRRPPSRDANTEAVLVCGGAWSKQDRMRGEEWTGYNLWYSRPWSLPRCQFADGAQSGMASRQLGGGHLRPPLFGTLHPLLQEQNTILSGMS